MTEIQAVANHRVGKKGTGEWFLDTLLAPRTIPSGATTLFSLSDYPFWAKGQANSLYQRRLAQISGSPLRQFAFPGSFVVELHGYGLSGPVQQLAVGGLGKVQFLRHGFGRFLRQQERAGLHDVPMFHSKDLHLTVVDEFQFHLVGATEAGGPQVQIEGRRVGAGDGDVLLGLSDEGKNPDVDGREVRLEPMPVVQVELQIIRLSLGGRRELDRRTGAKINA